MNPLQSSCLENPMNRGAWWAAVHGAAKSRTQLRDFTFTFHFHALEKEMATHCRGLAWRTPGTGEPGGLPSMGSHSVGHNWLDSAAAAGQYDPSFKSYESWVFVDSPVSRELFQLIGGHPAQTCLDWHHQRLTKMRLQVFIYITELSVGSAWE